MATELDKTVLYECKMFEFYGTEELRIWLKLGNDMIASVLEKQCWGQCVFAGEKVIT